MCVRARLNVCKSELMQTRPNQWEKPNQVSDEDRGKIKEWRNENEKQEISRKKKHRNARASSTTAQHKFERITCDSCSGHYSNHHCARLLMGERQQHQREPDPVRVAVQS